MISIPMKRELFIGFVYSFVYSFSLLPTTLGWGWPTPISPHPGGGGQQKEKDAAKLRFFLNSHTLVKLETSEVQSLYFSIKIW